MSMSRVALGVLRFGVGVYLIFTAIARIFAPIQAYSTFSLYSSLGLAPVNQGAVYYGITAFLAVLGLLLLFGRMMVLVGFLIFLLGLANGVSEIGASFFTPFVLSQSFALLNLGFRDLLVLAPVGLAIMAFDSQIRRKAVERRTGVKGVTLYPAKEQPAEEAPHAGFKLPDIHLHR